MRAAWQSRPPPRTRRRQRLSLAFQPHIWHDRLQRFGSFLRDLLRHPAGAAGAAIILSLTALSVYTVFATPYEQAISLWRSDDRPWYHNPVSVPPRWYNWFRAEKLPETIVLDSRTEAVRKTISPAAGGGTLTELVFAFDYTYTTPPQDVNIYLRPQFQNKRPFAVLTWIYPDGREIQLKNLSTSNEGSTYLTRDDGLRSKLKTNDIMQALFSQPNGSGTQPGRYEIRLTVLTFEPGSSLDVEAIIFGKVFGLAGTDASRRDLSLSLTWGLAVALLFGITAAAVTTFSSVTLAAASAWFGGWVDDLIQRITEVNMIIPVLPTCILIYFLYSKSFWAILGSTILLSIFGNAIKNYRAMFLQVKEQPYVEAARAYGASNWKIIFSYLIPRIRTVLIPQIGRTGAVLCFLRGHAGLFGGERHQPAHSRQAALVDQYPSTVSTSPYLMYEPVGLLILVGSALPCWAWRSSGEVTEQKCECDTAPIAVLRCAKFVLPSK